MPLSVRELVTSRRITRGEHPSGEVVYVVEGADQHALALAALAAVAPPNWDVLGDGTFILRREALSIEPRDRIDLWEGVARYSANVLPSTGDEPEYEFDTTGGAQHIQRSIQEVWAQGRPDVDDGWVPGHDNAINVTPDGIEGVEIVVPGFQFSETHVFEPQAIDVLYQKAVRDLTGTVNNAGFRGFDVGEVLFLGARGRQQGSGKWAITFSFASQPTAKDLAIGPIRVPEKKGWEYLSVEYEDEEFTVGSPPVRRSIRKRVKAVRVHQVYAYGDFGVLQLGGGNP